MKKLLIIGICIFLNLFGVFAMTYTNFNISSSTSNTTIQFTDIPIEVYNLSIESDYLYLYDINYTNDDLSVEMDDYNHSVANNLITSEDFPSIISVLSGDKNIYIQSNLNYTTNATLSFSLVGYPDEITYTTPNGSYDRVYGRTNFNFDSDTNIVTMFVSGIEPNTNDNNIYIHFSDTGSSGGGGGGGGSTYIPTIPIETINVSDYFEEEVNLSIQPEIIINIGSDENKTECDLLLLDEKLVLTNGLTETTFVIKNNNNIDYEPNFVFSYVYGNDDILSKLEIVNSDDMINGNSEKTFTLKLDTFCEDDIEGRVNLVVYNDDCKNIVIPIKIDYEQDKTIWQQIVGKLLTIGGITGIISLFFAIILISQSNTSLVFHNNTYDTIVKIFVFVILVAITYGIVYFFMT